MLMHKKNPPNLVFLGGYHLIEVSQIFVLHEVFEIGVLRGVEPKMTIKVYK